MNPLDRSNYKRVPLKSKTWVEVPLAIRGDAGSPALAEGVLTVTARDGERRTTQRRQLRLARGVVAYTEERVIRLGANWDSVAKAALACLENQHLRAEFIPEQAMLHALMPRETGRDLLLEGDYPLGFGWYGIRMSWKLRTLEADDSTAP